jgi:hypothetical protein
MAGREEIERERARLRASQPFYPCADCGSPAGRFDVFLTTQELVRRLNPGLVELFVHLPWRDAKGTTIPEVRDLLAEGPHIYFDGGSELERSTDQLRAVTIGEIAAEHQRQLRDWETWRPPELMDVPGTEWSTVEAVGEGLALLAAAGLARADSEDQGWYSPFLCPLCLAGRWDEPRLPGWLRTPDDYQRDADRMNAYVGALRETVQRPQARSAVPPRIRFEVLRRDGFRCTYCGRSAREGVVLHVDHVIPVAGGGSNDIENLVAACSSCNQGKGSTALV